MIDFATARRMMVDGQVRTSDVTDPRIIAAMLEIPRERFVPKDKTALAYVDLDVPIGEGGAGARRLLKPMVLAKLMQAAEIGPEDHVLDVGCATGYASAVLGHLAGSVVALEEERALARFAEEALRAAGAGNVTVVEGSLKAGWPRAAPYDVIFVGGATEIRPDTLLGQLKAGGRLVCVLGAAPASKAMRYQAIGAAEISGRPIFDASAPLLPGFAAPPAFAF